MAGAESLDGTFDNVYEDGRKLWEKFFMDMRTDQLTENDYFMDLEGNRFYPGAGLIPSQAPCYVHNVLPVPGMGSFFDIIPWGSSGILGVKWHAFCYIWWHQSYKL